jgi:hypothetical protein
MNEIIRYIQGDSLASLMWFAGSVALIAGCWRLATGRH